MAASLSATVQETVALTRRWCRSGAQAGGVDVDGECGAVTPDCSIEIRAMSSAASCAWAVVRASDASRAAADAADSTALPASARRPEAASSTSTAASAGARMAISRPAEAAFVAELGDEGSDGAHGQFTHLSVGPVTVTSMLVVSPGTKEGAVPVTVTVTVLAPRSTATDAPLIGEPDWLRTARPAVEPSVPLAL
ncbi:hypothetical protein AB1285_27180 [Microbacterium sp. NRRL B-14842]|uniref:hypothetical protein n=1 Tax=Microbacterium sp. NRRL B-14842 TaxID=3162881 RepID=UPI003D283A0F